MWVSKQMGHRDWVITARAYSRWAPSIVPDAESKLSAAMNANADQKADHRARHCDDTPQSTTLRE